MVDVSVFAICSSTELLRTVPILLSASCASSTGLASKRSYVPLRVACRSAFSLGSTPISTCDNTSDVTNPSPHPRSSTGCSYVCSRNAAISAALHKPSDGPCSSSKIRNVLAFSWRGCITVEISMTKRSSFCGGQLISICDISRSIGGGRDQSALT